ncbi:flagellar biosynthetic protein FliR [Fodinisporobacter ferrooxydans]|uniref:Flagellar biosynthetic protein FliR n=2 Tax=Fodinisporobacter ferrooxydans TaxID=2901836 RepID=A0ABY4CND1_9BACL|nr:flagellar biosynthetic protein FliR [Alicyclobacillaceae bacterium MYW30-H2]
MVMVMPFFSVRYIPAQVKIAFAMIVALLIVETIYSGTMGHDLSILSFGQFLFLFVKEVLVGLLLGFISSLAFAAIQFSGQLIDVQIGFSAITILDPQSNQPLPVIGNFEYILVFFIFLLEDGHQALIEAMLQSFTLIPVEHGVFTASILNTIIQSFSVLFLISLKLSIPIIGALFLTDVALAVISKAVPQINVFSLGYPVKIFIGLFLLAVIIPTLAMLFHALFQTMFAEIDDALHALGGVARK